MEDKGSDINRLSRRSVFCVASMAAKLQAESRQKVAVLQTLRFFLLYRQGHVKYHASRIFSFKSDGHTEAGPPAQACSDVSRRAVSGR